MHARGARSECAAVGRVDFSDRVAEMTGPDPLAGRGDAGIAGSGTGAEPLKDARTGRSHPTRQRNRGAWPVLIRALAGIFGGGLAALRSGPG